MKKIVIVSAFLAIFVLFLKPPTDPDLFWHLRYGEEIIKTGQFPYQDQFSFTFAGYWVADSWWLSEVLIYFLVSKTDFLVPALLFAFLGAVTFLAVPLAARVKEASLWAVCGSAFLGAAISFQILGFRPQTISLALFGLIFILLHQFWLDKRPKLIFCLPFIFLFWANLHAGFTLGLVLIWLFWGLESGRFLFWKVWKRQKLTLPALTGKKLISLFILNLFSILATFLNPYGIGLWRTILNDASSPTIKNEIQEWLAPNFHSEFGLSFFFYLLVLVVLAYLGKIRVHPTRFFIMLTFCLLALSAMRHISIFVLLATPFLAEELTVLPWRKFNIPYKPLALALFLLLFFLLWAFQVAPKTYEATRSIKNLAEEGGYPYEAVEYLKIHPQERILSEYGWGGYLIWQLPQSKTFIDGRMPGWEKNGKEILTDYNKIVNLENDGPQLLDSWQVQAVLLPPDYPLNQYLIIRPEWGKDYEDKTALIFTRR